MKKYKSEVSKPINHTKEKIKEASFSVTNIGSAQDAIIGSINIIAKIKKQPAMVGIVVGDGLITGIDSIDFGDDERMSITRKQMVIKSLLRTIIAYKKSLG